MRLKGVLIVVIVVVLFVFGNTYVSSRKEYKTELNFKISKIDITPTNSLELYDMKGEKISLWNFTLISNEGIIIGDSIYKGAFSEKLYVFKRNNDNRYKYYESVSPSGIFPLSWFCN